jgi:hypothetical protein
VTVVAARAHARRALPSPDCPDLIVSKAFRYSSARKRCDIAIASRVSSDDQKTASVTGLQSTKPIGLIGVSEDEGRDDLLNGALDKTSSRAMLRR